MKALDHRFMGNFKMEGVSPPGPNDPYSYPLKGPPGHCAPSDAMNGKNFEALLPHPSVTLNLS